MQTCHRHSGQTSPQVPPPLISARGVVGVVLKNPRNSLSPVLVPGTTMAPPCTSLKALSGYRGRTSTRVIPRVAPVAVLSTGECRDQLEGGTFRRRRDHLPGIGSRRGRRERTPTRDRSIPLRWSRYTVQVSWFSWVLRGSGLLPGPPESGHLQSGRSQVRPHPGPLPSPRWQRKSSLTRKIDHPIRRTRRVPRQGPPASRHRGTYCDSEGIGRCPFGCSGWPLRATWGHINRGQSIVQGGDGPCLGQVRPESALASPMCRTAHRPGERGHRSKGLCPLPSPRWRRC